MLAISVHFWGGGKLNGVELIFVINVVEIIFVINGVEGILEFRPLILI